MFIIVQPASDKKKKVPVRHPIADISEYRDYPDDSGIDKAVIKFHVHTGKPEMIVLANAASIDEQIKNSIKPNCKCINTETSH